MLVELAAAALLQITAAPAQPAPDGLFRVTVSGLDAPAADVVVHGGIAGRGKMFGLVPLRALGRGRWTTTLRAPGFVGVYPLRVRAGGTYRETQTVVAILPPGFAREPSGSTPADAVQAWRLAAPQGATIATVSTWRAGFYYHRDQRYNRLLRVKFTLIGAWPRYGLAAGTYTTWFDVVRTAQTAPWRIAGLVDAP
jgi:hypothetical protein